MSAKESTSRGRHEAGHRLDRQAGASLRNWSKPTKPESERMRASADIDMGWGRLIFGHTFESQRELVGRLLDEPRGRRDIAIYLRDPHVVLSLAPHRLFLDPSHTYRVWAHRYQPSSRPRQGFIIRRIRTRADAEAVNRIYATRHMVTADVGFMLDRNATLLRSYFIAETTDDAHQVVGTVTGVDHVEAFNDPENGGSLWCLAVDPQCQLPGVGEALVRQVVEHLLTRGRQYVDLSVMHDNEQAIKLYQKLGFKRVPVFCVKHKNTINEPLYTGPPPEAQLNPYAVIIISEARRRGIDVDVLDEEAGYFRLRLGGRAVTCRESLTELTTAIAMSRCDDKQVTRRVLAAAGLCVPDQQRAGGERENRAFLEQHQRIVVKPARGEQGAGITVDLRRFEDMEAAIVEARRVCDQVVLEQFVEGEDVRVIVINGEVVAAAVRRPAVVTGTGQHTVRQLIEKYNRRRAAATGGESRVPLDDETARCVRDAGFELDGTPDVERRVAVRKTANLHTGGTIHDVTDRLHPRLARDSVRAAEALDIPVVGLDLLAPSVAGPDYVIIEANERPGLANHEPAPTAQKFIDFLFPQSIAADHRDHR